MRPLWIGLEDLADVAQAAPRLAAVLGMTLAGATDPLVQVSDAVQGKRALLVFDNSEPCAGIAPLAELRAHACVPLKPLVKSRARRAIAGEWFLLLAGFPVPDAAETEPEAQRAFEAVKLFEPRARAVRPSFAALRAVGEVVLLRSLGGAPLAADPEGLLDKGVRLIAVKDDLDERGVIDSAFVPGIALEWRCGLGERVGGFARVWRW